MRSLRPNPRPTVQLHPALWSPVALPRLKGSIWSKILVDHIEFDAHTDEMREKFSLLPHVAPVFEGAFATDISFDTFRDRARREREWKDQQAIVAQSATAGGNSMSSPNDASSNTVATTGRRVPQQDRFAHMKTIDGSVYAAPPSSSAACFPASPFPLFHAKQWYVAYQILTRVLFPLTPEQVVEALYKMDDKVLTPERVGGLLRLMPTPDQAREIIKSERPLPLTPIERLYTLLSMRTSPPLAIRLSALHFQVEFGPLCQHLEETLDSLEKCVLEIKKSQNLRIILAILLHFGNFLNASHHVTPSYGFEIHFLSQVRKIRMTHTNSTLLDFLVYYLNSNYSHLSFSAFSTNSFPHLAVALKMDEWLFAMEMRYLNEEYRTIKQMNDEDEVRRNNSAHMRWL
jgi:hypothetical protein